MQDTLAIMGRLQKAKEYWLTQYSVTTDEKRKSEALEAGDNLDRAVAAIGQLTMRDLCD